MAKQQFSSIDEYGFQRPEHFDYLYYDKFMSKYYTILTNRRMKWERFIKNKPNLENTKSTKLKRYIRKGVPTHLRCEIWMKISGATKMQNESPRLYKNLLNTKYDDDIVEIIKMDLPRTFPENVLFDVIKPQLFNVLVAYAHHNVEVGYCQGLNYIAGLILLITKNDEITFWLLKIFVEKVVPSYHTKTMSGLIRDIGVLEKLMIKYVPEVKAHLERMGIPCAVIVTKWLICLFVEALPIETVFRIWDCIFSEGYKIIFRVTLTIFMANKDDILAAVDISALEKVLRDIVRNDKVTNCHEFMQSIFIMTKSLKRNEIKRLRDELTK